MFHGKTSHGKGDRPRPVQVSREELELRKSLAWAEISAEEFDEKLKGIRDDKEEKE